VRRGDVVVDLGAGDGALTEPLVELGCRVLALEVHPARAAALRERFAGTRVAVLELDVRAFRWPGHPFRWPGHPFRVVANPPYAGINALARDLLRVRQLRSADLVVAESAARGLLRHHPGRIRLGRQIPRAAFRHPPPESARVVLIRR
jgi:23S rRNA (adenine-N6)-dimethyltransferase